MTARPIVWSVAGSDSGAGAGIQADLKALEAFDVHGCTAIAALTAQNSVAVERVDAVSVEQLEAQLAALARDLRPQVIKTGLLGSAENVRCVAAWVDRLRRHGPVALVVDPVRRASTGAELAADGLRQAFMAELLPRATLITPNQAEAAWLLGRNAALAMADVPQAAAELRHVGARAVVITGGDAGSDESLDWIDTPQAQGWLALPRLDARHTHGTGCVYASSAAAALALGFCEADATVIAKMATTTALRHGYAAGQGAGPVRPRAGFALDADLLPTLRPMHAAQLGRFATLSDPWLGLYPVVDSAEWVERVLAAGVRTVQLRIKQAPHEVLSREVLRSVQAARAVGAQLFINDHWQLALEHGAYGVHLGQEDLQTLAEADLSAIRDAGVRLGLSTHSYWEVCRAHGFAPSYIACGPIHATTTKDMPWRPQGAANLAYWCHVLREPVVAIAGMDEPRSLEAVRCGAAGIAVLRGIVQAAQPERAIHGLQDAIGQGRAAERIEPPALPRSTLAGPVPWA